MFNSIPTVGEVFEKVTCILSDHVWKTYKVEGDVVYQMCINCKKKRKD